jgi:5-methylcytosine-specific restriction endonuclease McrA
MNKQTLSCQYCNKQYNPAVNKDGSIRKTKYNACSSYCKFAVRTRIKPKATDITLFKGYYCCEVCGKTGLRNRSSTNTKKNYGSKYCSKLCYGKALTTNAFNKNKFKTIETYLNKLLLPIKRKIKQKETFLRSSLEKLLRNIKDKSNPCEMCCSPVGYLFGRKKLYCSNGCRKQSPRTKAGQRKHKAKRKAIEKGATTKPFDPIMVLERDGWKCKMCGIDTPKEKRGSYDLNAPEVDHIHPISKGGEHSMENTQCLCRRCNASKGNKILD